MAKTKEQKPGAAETPEQKPVDIQDDEYRGMGGSYIFDPATGKRTRNYDKQPADAQPITETEVSTDESK